MRRNTAYYSLSFVCFPTTRRQLAPFTMAPISHSQLDEQTAHNPSPFSSPGSSSDKENPRPRSINKRTNPRMAPPSHNKRRRLTDRTSNIHSQAPSSQRAGKNKFYDPDQDVNERRLVRRNLRNVTRDFNGMPLRTSETRLRRDKPRRRTT